MLIYVRSNCFISIQTLLLEIYRLKNHHNRLKEILDSYTKTNRQNIQKKRHRNFIPPNHLYLFIFMQQSNSFLFIPLSKTLVVPS